MIGGNDTRRQVDLHAVDSFSCDDAACEGIAKIRAGPFELAEATVASEADFRGLFTAFSEATAVDTEETTEATAFPAFSSATDAAVLVEILAFRGLLAAILDVTAGDTVVTTEGICASEAGLLDVTIVDTSVFAAEAVSQGNSCRGGPGSSLYSIPQTTPSASPVSPDKYTTNK